jgi:hypothetical protein
MHWNVHLPMGLFGTIVEKISLHVCVCVLLEKKTYNEWFPREREKRDEHDNVLFLLAFFLLIPMIIFISVVLGRLAARCGSHLAQAAMIVFTAISFASLWNCVRRR